MFCCSCLAQTLRRRRLFIAADLSALVRSTLFAALQPWLSRPGPSSALEPSGTLPPERLLPAPVDECVEDCRRLLSDAVAGLGVPSCAVEQAPGQCDFRGVRRVATALVDREAVVTLAAASRLPLSWFFDSDDDATLLTPCPPDDGVHDDEDAFGATCSTTGSGAAPPTFVRPATLARVWCPVVVNGDAALTHDAASSGVAAAVAHLCPGWWKWCEVLEYDAALGTVTVVLIHTPLYGHTPPEHLSAAYDSALPRAVAAPSRNAAGGTRGGGGGGGSSSREQQSSYWGGAVGEPAVFVVLALDVCVAGLDPGRHAARLGDAYRARALLSASLLQEQLVRSVDATGIVDGGKQAALLPAQVNDSSSCSRARTALGFR